MTNPKIDEKGTKRWYNENGALHREDGPAVEYPNGCYTSNFRNGYIQIGWDYKQWYINGKRIT